MLVSNASNKSTPLSRTKMVASTCSRHSAERRSYGKCRSLLVHHLLVALAHQARLSSTSSDRHSCEAAKTWSSLGEWSSLRGAPYRCASARVPRTCHHRPVARIADATQIDEFCQSTRPIRLVRRPHHSQGTSDRWSSSGLVVATGPQRRETSAVRAGSGSDELTSRVHVT